MQFRNKIKYATALLCFASVNAHAALSSANNGLGVYDSGLNATWTSDANLLGTLESQQGYDTVVNAIIAASPTIHDTPNDYDNGGIGIYNLSADDFRSNSTVNWWAAQAFTNYLNHINYGNSNQWALPSQPNQDQGYNVTSSQLGALFYNELGGTAGHQNPANSLFSNEYGTYWSSTEIVASTLYGGPVKGGNFNTLRGMQSSDYKGSYNYVWAVSPGQVNAVPVPGAIWLFGSALVGLIGYGRRKIA